MESLHKINEGIGFFLTGVEYAGKAVGKGLIASGTVVEGVATVPRETHELLTDWIVNGTEPEETAIEMEEDKSMLDQMIEAATDLNEALKEKTESAKEKVVDFVTVEKNNSVDLRGLET